MKLEIFNQSGKTVSEKIEIKLPKSNLTALRQDLHRLTANSSIKAGHTKTRAEVSGTGKKPWRQKGTGRARAGSLRSPIFIGGGIVFGPRHEKTKELKIPRKIRLLAIKQAIQEKISQKTLKVLSQISLADSKTKTASQWLKNFLPIQDKILIITKDLSKEIATALRNIKSVKYLTNQNFNSLDLMNARLVLIEKSALAIIFPEIEKVSLKPEAGIQDKPVSKTKSK